MRQRFKCRDGFLEVRGGKVFFNGQEEVTGSFEEYGVADSFRFRRALKASKPVASPEPAIALPEPLPPYDVEDFAEGEPIDVDLG